MLLLKDGILQSPSPLSSHRVYRRRWYILLLFATLELHQCLVWNTFGPIAFAVKFAYRWSDATLAMLLNW